MSLVNCTKWLSFKLSSADFPQLPFPSVSKHVFSAYASLPFITTCRPFLSNINIQSSKYFVFATNTSISSVHPILSGNFFSKLIHNLSKSFISDVVCNIRTKHNHWTSWTHCCKCKFYISACVSSFSCS